MKGFISFKARLLIGFGAIILLILILIGLSLQQFFSASTGLTALRDVVSPQAWDAEKMTTDVIQVQQFLTDVSATHDPEGYQEAEAFAGDFKKTIKQLYDNKLSATQATELAAIEQAFEVFYQLGRRMAAAYVSEGTQAGNVLMDEFDKSSLALAGRMTKFRDEAVGQEKSITSTLAKAAQSAVYLIVVIGCIVLCVSLLITVYLLRYLDKQLGIDPFFAKSIALEIAKGNLSRTIAINADDKSSLLYAMTQMQQQILQRITAANKLIEEMTRIKVALDNVSTGVMIANNERKIIYANKSAVNILGKAEKNIRKHLPSFSASQLIGASFDSFHADPSHQAQLIATLTDTHTANINVGGHSMVVMASPVINEQGQQLGVVTEWQDRTAQVLVEEEVEMIVAAAASGDFSRRVIIAGKERFFRNFGEALNQLLHTCETSLNEIGQVLEAMAHGDLTKTITTDYSGTFGVLKDGSNASAEKLKEVITLIKDAADNISNGAKQIAAGNNDLAHRTEEQAASLEETAASMEELISTVQQNAENAKQANELVVSASDTASEGVKVVGKVVTTMEEISSASREIVNIISVIDGIAFQTNILALNAAVEAARAGEQGRGFAVVAVEVRNLAQRAAAAAGEIKGLIINSVEKVEYGTKLVAHAGKTMEEILGSVHNAAVMMSDISAASLEQTYGIEQVNLAINQMDEVTQQNAALVGNAAAAADSQEKLAQSLVDTVGYFTVDDNDSNDTPSYPQQTKATVPSKTSKSHAATKLKAIAADEWEEF